jgi:hypothetical protein
MMFLNHLAGDFDVGLLIIHHMRKLTVRSQFFEFQVVDARGSGHITAMGRTVMALSIVQTGEQFNRNGPRRFEVGKTNLGIYPPPLGFSLESFDPDGVALRWGEVPRPFHQPTQKERCQGWLAELLQSASAPIKTAEIIRLAAQEGFNERMVYRARLALAEKVGDSLNKQHPENGWVWCPGGDRNQSS